MEPTTERRFNTLLKAMVKGAAPKRKGEDRQMEKPEKRFDKLLKAMLKGDPPKRKANQETPSPQEPKKQS